MKKIFEVSRSHVYLIENSLSADECSFLVNLFNTQSELAVDGEMAQGIVKRIKDTKDILIRDNLHIPDIKKSDDILFGALSYAMKLIHEKQHAKDSIRSSSND